MMTTALTTKPIKDEYEGSLDFKRITAKDKKNISKQNALQYSPYYTTSITMHLVDPANEVTSFALFCVKKDISKTRLLYMRAKHNK